VVAAFLLGLTACGSGITAGPHLAAASDGSPAGSAPSASSLTETGSTLLFPLMRTWAAAYHQQFPDVTAWPPVRGALGRRGNNGVVAGCEAVPGCVAYVGISYLSQALAGGLGEAALANAAGQFVLPTAAAISASVASFVSLTPSNETISMVDGPAAHGYPIVNYRVRHRQHQAIGPGQGAGHKSLPYLGDHQGKLGAIPEPGKVPAAARGDGYPRRPADRTDQLMARRSLAATMPAKLWMLSAGLVLLSLAWGC